MEEKNKILIVDDDEFLLDMYAVKFKESGFDVETAFSGQDALDKIKAGLKPNMVLLDVVMPGVSGFDFLKIVNDGKLLPNSQIIVLTNLGQREDVEKGIQLGAKDYIIKAHHTPSEVVNKVKKLLYG